MEWPGRLHSQLSNSGTHGACTGTWPPSPDCLPHREGTRGPGIFWNLWKAGSHPSGTFAFVIPRNTGSAMQRLRKHCEFSVLPSASWHPFRYHACPTLPGRFLVSCLEWLPFLQPGIRGTEQPWHCLHTYGSPGPEAKFSLLLSETASFLVAAKANLSGW